jgi:urate oxidase
VRLETHYGKAQVSTYRVAARALEGVTVIPESAFTGRTNRLLAAEIDVQVLGEAFTAAYTEGDNSMVVATDSMKNFIHRESLAFDGSTLEGWLSFIAGRFLETYPQMERLRVSAEEIRFDPARVPASDGGFTASEVLFHRRHDDRGIASLEVGRDRDGSVVLGDLRSGRVGLDLLKTTGSAFADFSRDEYTTLPSRSDRLLFTHMDIAWRYEDPRVAIMPEPSRYVHPDQVADLAAVVFHEFVSLSIQHLVHEIGSRMLERYGSLVEVSFEAQNRTLDLAEASTLDERAKVYTDPRPPYGRIGLTMRRDDQG